MFLFTAFKLQRVKMFKTRSNRERQVFETEIPRYLRVFWGSSFWQRYSDNQGFWLVRSWPMYVLITWFHESWIFCLFYLFFLRNGILSPKLFWPSVRKTCSSDQEKLLKFEAEGRVNICNFLWSLQQFIQTLKGQKNFWNRMFF